MISLQDEIGKFQKLVYNKQLAEFVTVDQMFVGGGITMESIIHESSFVIEELKKMNAVFRNYCKLNEKVYTKIMEHELSVHSEQARLNALVSSIERKFQDSVKKIKQLHEDTQAQNQKSHSIIENSIEPLRKILDQKVDLSTFSQQMKKFLENYDDGDNAHGENHEQRRSGNQGGGSERQPNSPYPRKKGKLGYDEFYKFREELDKILKASEEKAGQLESVGGQTKNLILKYIPHINNVVMEVGEHKTELHKLNNAQNEHSIQLVNSVNKMHLELNSRINQQVWNSKFDGFLDRHIKPIVHRLEDSLKGYYQNFGAYREQSIHKFKEIDSQFLKSKTAMTIAKRDIQKINLQIQDIDRALKESQAKQDQQNYKLNKDIESISQQFRKSLTELQQSTQKQFRLLDIALKNLSQTIEQSVVKAVSKKFQIQLKLIEGSIRQNRDNIKKLSNQVGLILQQIKHIKDLLSRKANFSDIILHVEKKADKQDFKQLQSKLHETSQNFFSKNLNESFNLSKIQKTENASTRRIPSISRTSKTLLAGHNTNEKTEKMEMDSGTKLFMCGFEGHLTDTKKPMSQSSRRKNMKSSAAHVSDFLL